MKDISRIDLIGKYIDKPTLPVEPEDYIGSYTCTEPKKEMPLSEYLTKHNYKLEDLYVKTVEFETSNDYYSEYPVLHYKQLVKIPEYRKETYKKQLENYKIQLALYEEYQKLLDVFRKSETEFRDKVRNELTEFLIEEIKK